ncbi:hypothetical protein [Pedobacter ureilyticus]|uniref:DUF4843 domain-containing protein n=1 Tax=Pedobacter ureilyticus TaxID=1393051 RepID=A0ABW9J4T1_9SPHI|nr:hypothetical protein [Pedobacter helvus]
MTKTPYLIFQLFLILTLNACNNPSEKTQDSQIWMVVQPQVELNRTTTAKVFFRARPDTGSIKVIQLENEADYALDGRQIESELKSDGKNYYYAIEFTAGKLGKTTLPLIEASIAGETYTSAKVPIQVVDKQTVDPSAVRLVLTADQSSYQQSDTISFTLDEYSKFAEMARFTPADLVKKGAPEALFAIIDEGNVDYKVGIVGFKTYIDAHFNVASFDWNVNRIDQKMASLDNGSYIQTQLFRMKAIAKKKGKFKIDGSRFEYKVYPHSEAFREEILSSEDLLRKKNRWTVQSNSLEIDVR